jgi:hypothetical protein
MLSARQYILVALLITIGYPLSAQTIYSQRAKIPPLRISISELQTVINKGVSLMNSANGPIPILYEETRLQKGDLIVKIRDHTFESEISKTHNIIDAFQYRVTTRDSAPIMNFECDFSHDFRTLSVEGQSPEQVDAVFSAIKDDLLKLSTTLGGLWVTPIRLIFAMILMCFLLVEIAAWHDFHRRIFLSLMIITIVAIIALCLLPINDIFAGFLAIPGDTSFKVRYGYDIALWGLLFAIGTALPQVFIWRSSTHPETTKKTAPKDLRKNRKERTTGKADRQ